MREDIKNLKQVKVQKDALMAMLLELQLKEKKILNDLHECRQKQARCAYDIEAMNKRAFELIGELK